MSDYIPFGKSNKIMIYQKAGISEDSVDDGVNETESIAKYERQQQNYAVDNDGDEPIDPETKRKYLASSSRQGGLLQ